MIQLFHPLPTLIATAFDSLLAKYVLYLKNENRILRDRLPGEIRTKPHERAQLLKYGKPLGKSINELITIVTPGTFHRWVAKHTSAALQKVFDAYVEQGPFLRILITIGSDFDRAQIMHELFCMSDLE